jgi:hypothetical protein
MDTFVTATVQSMKDLVDLSDNLSLFVFRGQADARWELTTSIERAFLRSGKTIYSLENTEHWMLDEFMKKFRLHSKEAPQTSNKFEWLALMQHFGGATRLLDFTESIYVSAYFATLDASHDSAIWAINKPRLRDSLCDFAKLQYKKSHDLKDIVNKHHIDTFNSFSARPHAGENDDNLTHLIPLEPQILFERASRQRGLFIGAGHLSSSNGNVSYMDNLKASFHGFPSDNTPKALGLKELCSNVYIGPCYDRYGIVKIIIPREIHSKIRGQLEKMGLTEESLFPGLDGLSRAITQSYILGNGY